MISASEMNVFLRCFSDTYAAWMQPLNQQHQLPPNGLDILLFLANNPGKDTAKDICRYRHLKPGIISLTVEKLVQAGYLQRQSVPEDRRKDCLVCTPAADEIIQQGRQRQMDFAKRFYHGLTEEEIACAMHIFAVVEQNLVQMNTEENKNANK